jgi:ribosome-associated translation inhibitor RaiA
MDELDFTLELSTDLSDKEFEDTLFIEAESRLRQLRGEHNDMTGAAVTIRMAAAGETPLYEASVVAYVRPENIAGREQDRSPANALNGALDAVERQVRAKREKLGRPWEQPGNAAEDKEIEDLVAAELELGDDLGDESGQGGDKQG